MSIYEVVSPLGRRSSQRKSRAARPRTLDGVVANAVEANRVLAEQVGVTVVNGVPHGLPAIEMRVVVGKPDRECPFELWDPGDAWHRGVRGARYHDLWRAAAGRLHRQRADGRLLATLNPERDCSTRGRNSAIATASAAVDR